MDRLLPERKRRQTGLMKEGWTKKNDVVIEAKNTKIRLE